MKKYKKVPESWKLTFLNLTSVSKHVGKKLWNFLTQPIELTHNQIQVESNKTFENVFSICVSTKYLQI